MPDFAAPVHCCDCIVDGNTDACSALRSNQACIWISRPWFRASCVPNVKHHVRRRDFHGQKAPSVLPRKAYLRKWKSRSEESICRWKVRQLIEAQRDPSVTLKAYFTVSALCAI